MKFHNFTPFWPLQFEGCDKKRNRFGVVVLKGTFTIEHGKRLRLSDPQEPLTMTDQYFGAPEATGLRVGNSLAPYKPKTDVVVIADAYSPSRLPETTWPVSVDIGTINKRLTVTGPRQWVRTRHSFALSAIEPVRRVPVRYELAYGGSYEVNGQCHAWAGNPVGVGFCDIAGDDLPAVPQVLPFNCGEPRFGQPVETVGFAPIAPSWQPRVAKAGTFDAEWQSTSAPNLPNDFSFEFHNIASPGLVLPGFAEGDEPIRLINLSRERELIFGLPQIVLATILHFEDGRMVPGPIHLDTIHIEVEARRVYLHWRGIYPNHIPIKALEVRMDAPEDLLENAA